MFLKCFVCFLCCSILPFLCIVRVRLLSLRLLTMLVCGWVLLVCFAMFRICCFVVVVDQVGIQLIIVFKIVHAFLSLRLLMMLP